MIDHPMLARTKDEDLAYIEGTYAGMMLDRSTGIERLRHLLTLKRCARNDPSAAYNLATEFVQDNPSPVRRHRAALLQSKAIAMVKERIADPAAAGWHPREKSIRRLGSMAMVNLGNIRQYGLKLPEIAHADYLEAARMYDGNEIAHLNVGTMNLAGLVASPDGELALRHYHRALGLGVYYKSRTPGCNCVVTIVEALEHLPSGERTAALPRIRAMIDGSGSDVLMPPTTGLAPADAAAIEDAVDAAFADLDRHSPIERRVTRIASLAATLSWLYAGCTSKDSDGSRELDFATAIVDGIGEAQRRPAQMIMISGAGEHEADRTRCEAMYADEELVALHEAVTACVRRILGIAQRSGVHGPVHTHALKIVLGSASPGWRPGLLATMPNGFLNPPMGPLVRVAIPAAVGAA